MDIHPTTNSIRRLKEKVKEAIVGCINVKVDSDRMILYNYKGLELDDSDVEYLKNKQIIYVSLDGSPFNTVNYVNQFEFIKYLKSGGFGKVYLAVDLLTNNQVAVKVIDTSHLNSDEIRNISKEASYLESFKHRNIIKLIISFFHNNVFYSVMECAKGGELNTYIKEKGLFSENEAKKLFKQVHEAVRYIHLRSVIHRDLSPMNILFLDESKENVVIIDFGISGVSKGNIKEKINAGTIRFIPPEVASGSNISSSTKIDNWALGVILYIMLFGIYPFDGKDDGDIMYKIAKENLIFPKTISISPTSKKIINLLLEKNPNFRVELTDPIFEEWYNEE